MIFGNLNDILNDEEYINESINNMTTHYKPKYNMGSEKKQTTISKILFKLSNYGMNYSDDVIKNMRAIPADKGLGKTDDIIFQNSFFQQQMNNYRNQPEEEKKFAEKTLAQRLYRLRLLSQNPELEDILDIMSNECIVYDDEQAYIAQPFFDTALINDLNESSAEEIKAAMNKGFYKIYQLLDLKKKAWDIFKKYLIEGVLCYQITYDNIKNPKAIIGITECDPTTLTKEVREGITYWVQYKGMLGQERELLDSEIIYIKYEDTGMNTRQSYLERLIRPFNIYRIIEEAQVIWTVTNASFKTMFTIPVGNQSLKNGIQTLNAAMNRYKEDISFNSETGELRVNGKMNMPFNKEYWMPQNENGKPEIQQLVDNGPNLNDSEQLKFFKQILIGLSKIPYSRFDRENQASWFGTDPTQTLRDEINFGRFVTRLRNNYAEIILKPLRIYLAITIPDLKNDKRILDALSLTFNSYNQFEELMDMEIMGKRIEFIQNMQNIKVKENGEEVDYFATRFLIERYLKLSEADVELNEKYKQMEKMNGNEGATETADDLMGGDEENGGETGEETGGAESEESGEIDTEMMGDVQPESTETTEA